MTKREFFVAVTNKNVTDEMVEMAKKYITQLDNKVENRKPTAKQVENEKLKTEIVNLLGNAAMTATEIAKTIDKEDVSVNRVSALVTQMVNDKKLIRSVVKRVPYFTVAA